MDYTAITIGNETYYIDNETGIIISFNDCTEYTIEVL